MKNYSYTFIIICLLGTFLHAELTENEYDAAQRHKERYYLYRVFVDPTDLSRYEVAILPDPVHSKATRTVTRFDLSRGSGATWYGLEETTEEA